MDKLRRKRELRDLLRNLSDKDQISVLIDKVLEYEDCIIELQDAYSEFLVRFKSFSDIVRKRDESCVQVPF